MQIAFIGSVVEETEVGNYPGCSFAGNRFQLELLRSLSENDLTPKLLLSARSAYGFPHFRRLVFQGKKAKIHKRLSISYLPFVNLPLFRTILIACQVIIRLAWWGRRSVRAVGKMVVCYNVASPHGLAILIGARLAGAKLVIIAADLTIPGSGVSSSLLRRLNFSLQVLSLRLSDGLVVVNPNIVSDFAPHVRYIHVEGGVADNTALLLIKIPELEDYLSGKQCLLYVGALDKIRGITLILEAFRFLKGDQFRLLVAGWGPLKNVLYKAAIKDSRINYLGYVKSHQELLSLYTRSSILLCPYLTNAPSTRYIFPSKLLEYLATGRPVISTASTSVAEIYGEYLYLLRDETPTGLVELIYEVSSVDLEERRRRAQKAKLFIMQNKTWSRQGIKIANFIRQIARSNTG